jgi:hypothetical protein
MKYEREMGLFIDEKSLVLAEAKRHINHVEYLE